MWIDTQPDTEIPTPQWADHIWTQEWVKLSGFRLLWPDVVGCSLTAARIYGLPLPNRLAERALHVASTQGNRTISRPGVEHHRYQNLRSNDLFDLPLISVPQLIVELAPLLTVDELVVLGDAAIGRQNSGPLTTLDQLRSEIGGRTYLRGRGNAERALSLIRETVDSPRETRLRLWLAENGFPEPVVHPAVFCPLVQKTLHPDLGYPELKLAIEYEGDHHRTSAGQFSADIERRQLLEAEGWTVLRVSKRTDMNTFKKILASHLAQ